jgi:hypothetical protein
MDSKNFEKLMLFVFQILFSNLFLFWFLKTNFFFKPRYGHSQITLDDERILIIGGCGGPNKQYDDIWILNWPKDYNLNASWQQVLIHNHINSPSQLYCMSFVRCNNKLVTLGKPRMPSSSIQSSFTGLIGEQFIKNDNINGLNNPLTIYGPSKTAQPRRCSCSSNLSLDKLSSANSSSTNTSAKNMHKMISSSSVPTSSSIQSNQPKTGKESPSLDNFRRNNEDNLSSSVNNDAQITLLNKSQRNTIKRYIISLIIILNHFHN